jgi:hypothetical protein
MCKRLLKEQTRQARSWEQVITVIVQSIIHGMTDNMLVISLLYNLDHMRRLNEMRKSLVAEGSRLKVLQHIREVEPNLLKDTSK